MEMVHNGIGYQIKAPLGGFFLLNMSKKERVEYG